MKFHDENGGYAIHAEAMTFSICEMQRRYQSPYSPSLERGLERGRTQMTLFPQLLPIIALILSKQALGKHRCTGIPHAGSGSQDGLFIFYVNKIKQLIAVKSHEQTLIDLWLICLADSDPDGKNFFSFAPE